MGDDRPIFRYSVAEFEKRERYYVGDVRLRYPECDDGKLWSEIYDFDVWDGERWVPKEDVATRVTVVRGDG